MRALLLNYYSEQIMLLVSIDALNISPLYYSFHPLYTVSYLIYEYKGYIHDIIVIK